MNSVRRIAVYFTRTARSVFGSEHTTMGVWDDSLIFPELTATDKVKVTRDDAARGEIVDRSGRMLAGKGVGSSVGLAQNFYGFGRV